MPIVYSPSGAITTGDCNNGFGDFTDELLTINENLSKLDYPDGYPITDWTNFEVEIPGSGSVAFIYYVTDAGLFGTNSNFIGIDSVTWEVDDIIFENSFETIILK